VTIAVGDIIPTSPGTGFEVKVLEPGRSLVLRTTFTPLVDGTQDELAMRAWARPDSQAAEVVA
jgi:hypothetical protein